MITTKQWAQEGVGNEVTEMISCPASAITISNACPVLRVELLYIWTLGLLIYMNTNPETDNWQGNKNMF